MPKDKSNAEKVKLTFVVNNYFAIWLESDSKNNLYDHFNPYMVQKVR